MAKVFIIIFILNFSSFCFAQEEIEESAGLQAVNEKDERSVLLKPITDHNYRAYLEINTEQAHLLNDQVRKRSFAEASLTFDYVFYKNWGFFLDGIAQERSYESHQFSYVNSAGFRWLSGNHSFAFGKERNRNSPGMIVSPSDRLHSNEAVPGAKEQRRGEWIARYSFLTSDFGLNLIYLIADQQKVNGMPELDQRRDGWNLVARNNWIFDLAINYLHKEKERHFGVFWQDMIWKRTTKIYIEHGSVNKKQMNDEWQQARNYLLGLSFENIKDWTLASEYYFHGEGISEKDWEIFYNMQKHVAIDSDHAQPTMFVRQKYLISSLKYFPQDQDWQWTFSHIYALEDQGQILVNNLHYNLHENHKLKFEYMRILSREHSAYQFAPVHWQSHLGWRYSF